MGLSPLLSGWWVLILVGVVGLLLLSAAAIYVITQPTKSTVTLPPRAPARLPQHPMMHAWSPGPPNGMSELPMTVPMGGVPLLPPPFQSPDQTLPLAALTGAMLDRMTALTASTAPPSTGKPASKAPLPLRPNATLVSATPPALPRRAPFRTLPPPGSRVPARPFSLAVMGPTKAAEVLALQLDSDLPPAMQAPDAPDTERSLEEDDAPTMMTTWDSMATRRGST